MQPLPDSGIPGLKSFDAQLMRGSDGTSMMVSNDVFRMYFGYVTICRSRGREPEPFGLWISESGRAQGRVNTAPGSTIGR